jgi:hypothetical protein
MTKRKSFTQKQREKRIQAQVEKLGGSKKKPQPKTLKKAVDDQFERAMLIQRFPFSSTSKKEGTMLDLAGYAPASSADRNTAMFKGSMGLFKEKVPKELRDRLKAEKSTKKVKGKSLGGYMGAVMAGRGGSFKGSS